MVISTILLLVALLVYMGWWYYADQDPTPKANRTKQETGKYMQAMLTFETGYFCQYEKPNKIYINGKEFIVDLTRPQKEIDRIKNNV